MPPNQTHQLPSKGPEPPPVPQPASQSGVPKVDSNSVQKSLGEPSSNEPSWTMAPRLGALKSVWGEADMVTSMRRAASCAWAVAHQPEPARTDARASAKRSKV